MDKLLKKSADKLFLAHAACLLMGVGLVLWSFIPALIKRMLTGYAPTTESLLSAISSGVLGFAFIGLHILVRRAVRWALWTVFAISTVLFVAGLALMTTADTNSISSCLLLLAGCAAFASWLTIVTKSQETMQQARENARPKHRFNRSMFTRS